MTNDQITYSEAVALAIGRAQHVLRGLFPENASEVFEHPVLRGENFWLFFRNRNITVSTQPNGENSDDCAFAVGDHGLTLTVEDNFDNKQKLDEQIKGLSQYFAKRDM